MMLKKNQEGFIINLFKIKKTKTKQILNSNKILISIMTIMIFSMMSFVNADIESPKKQLKNGISSEEIQCNTGLELIIRNNGTPACVKPETVEKMQQRGMLFNSIKFTDLQKEIKIIPASGKEIETVPASSMSIVNFYITDHDLNVAHGGVEVIPIQGLFEFTINGIAVEGPENMIETGPDTGQFYIKLELPETIDGRALSQEDIVLIKYLDSSDHSGEKRVLIKSVPLQRHLPTSNPQEAVPE